MKEIGIDMSQKEEYYPKKVDDSISYFKIYSMGCNVDCRIKVDEDLGISDPAGKSINDVREIRDMVKKEVERTLRCIK